MNLRARYRDLVASAPRVYWIVWWGTLINRLGTFVIPLLTIYLTQQRGLTGEEAGAIVSVYGLGSILASFVGGYFADHVGRRFTMVLSLVSGAGLMVVLGRLDDLVAIEVVVGLLGFAGEMYRPAVSAFVSDVTPEAQRRRAYGLLYWAVNLGWAVAAAVGGAIATYDFHILFYVDAITMAAFGVLVAVAIPETRPTAAVRADQPPSAAWWRDRVFVIFVAINFLMVLLPYQAGAALSLHMTAQGFSPVEYGLVLACNGVLIVLFQPWLTARIDRYDANRILVAAALLYGGGLAMHGLASLLIVHMAAAAVWTIAEILESPTRTALIALMAPADARGRYQGAFVMTWGAGQLLGPRLGTIILGRLGAPALWLGCLGLGSFVAIAFAATARDRRARVAADLAKLTG